jgi:hypothetical protein
MSMDDLITCGFGSLGEQCAMVRRWIDARHWLWASESIRGVTVHIHTVTTTGGDFGVDVPPDDAAVLADYAAACGHPQASHLACAWRRTQP